MSVHSTLVALALGLCLAFGACGGASSPGGGEPGSTTFPLPGGDTGYYPPSPPPSGGGSGDPLFPELTGGVLVTVETQGEIWRWWVTNPPVASLLQRAWVGTYQGMFHARLRAGPGEAGHNAPWSWHADPVLNGGDMIFVQPPAPGSSPSTPSECESRLAEWLTKDTNFVPYYPFKILTFDDRRP